VTFGTEVPKYQSSEPSTINLSLDLSGRDRADKTRYDYGNDAADRGIPQERNFTEKADRYHGQEAGKPTY
jgi:hypothetical protein